MKLLCDELGWKAGVGVDLDGDPRTAGRDPPYAKLHRALIAGLPTQLGNRGDRGLYEGPRGRKFMLFPGSTLAKKPPPWVLSATLLDLSLIHI